MNAVDGSDHYSTASEEPPPSLLTIILDTNPHAWSLLAPTLPLSAAIANLLVFIDAHLAFNNANKIALIASHPQRAEFLYPLPTTSTSTSQTNSHGTSTSPQDGDTEMSNTSPPPSPTHDANHYRPFAHIQTTLLRSLTSLFNHTPPSSLTPTTSLSGALTLALTYINKLSLTPSTTTATTSQPDQSSTHETPPSLHSRILILSVSGDLATQHIQIMNAIFACQRLRIPIDVAKIAGDPIFLQQASDATSGTYIPLSSPRGLLQYLMMAFLPDQASRRYLVAPSASHVDFRAACFCHRKVVDVGFVCSVCLAIFCSPPEGAICPTCSTHLRLGSYGGKPIVVARKKKKKKEGVNGKGKEGV